MQTWRPLLWGAVLGTGSGCLSSFTEELPLLPEQATALIAAAGLNAGAMWPGIWFGLAIAFLTWMLADRRYELAVGAFIGTFVGWRLAVECALKVFDFVHHWTGSEVAALGVAGFAGGFVGAVAASLVPLTAVPSRARWISMLRVAFVGAVMGILLRWSLGKDGAGALLYVAWQAVVAAAIGSVLAHRSPHGWRRLAAGSLQPSELDAISNFWSNLRATRAQLLLLIAGWFALFATGQGQELKLSLQGLSPIDGWLVLFSVLFWAVQSWFWARVTLDVAATAPPAAVGSPANGVATLLPLLYASLIITLVATQFASVGANGFASLLGALGLAFAAAIFSDRIATRPLSRSIPPHQQTLLPVHSWLSRTLGQDRKMPDHSVSKLRWVIVSYLSSAGVLGTGMWDPLILSENFHTLGVLFLAFGVLVPLLSTLVLVTRNARIPTIALCLLVPFVAAEIYAWLGDLLVFVVLAIGASVLLARSLSSMALRAGLMLALALLLPLMQGVPHRVRQAPGEASVPRASGAHISQASSSGAFDPSKRPVLSQAVAGWHQRAIAAASAPPSIVFVSAAGGGLRAAYWTAAVLARLQDCLPDVDSQIFSISGVSGGSLGAMVYQSLLQDTADQSRHLPCNRYPMALSDLSEVKGRFQEWASDILQRDFLAPAAAALLFRDVIQSLAPGKLFEDRASALEKAFEVAWERACDRRPHADPCRDRKLFGAPFLHRAQHDRWLPLLFINGTHLETGKRIITAQMQIGRAFVDAYDFHALVHHDIPRSTAVLNSARFPLLSPAGTLLGRGNRIQGHVLDGAYFENNGAVTSLELARAVLEELARQSLPVRPVFIEILNDAELLEGDLARSFAPLLQTEQEEMLLKSWASGEHASEVASPANQLTAPLSGLGATRAARGVLASKMLANFATDKRAAFVQFRLCPHMRPNPQLAWLLSAESRSEMDALLLGHDRLIFEQRYKNYGTPELESYMRCFNDTQQQLARVLQLLRN